MESISKEHRQKIVHFKKMLQERKDFNGIPFFWQLLWKMGVEIPPPYFLPFRQTLLLSIFSNTFYAGVIVLLVIVYLGAWSSWYIFLIAIPISGLLVGFLKAALWQRKAKKMQLPQWSDFLVPTD
jgi:Family of unknown function (DUF6404)